LVIAVKMTTVTLLLIMSTWQPSIIESVLVCISLQGKKTLALYREKANDWVGGGSGKE